MSKVAFLSRGDITDLGWNSPEFNERLTILVIVGTSMDAHCFRRQVGMRMRCQMRAIAEAVGPEGRDCLPIETVR